MSGQDFSKPKRKNAVSFQSPFECDSSSLKQYGLPPLTPLDKPSYSRTSSIMGLSTFDGFSAAGSVVGADWLEEIDFAFKELTLENDLEIKENTISEDEKNIEFMNVELAVEEDREMQRKVRSHLAHEFKKIYFEARDRNKQIKKIFRSYLEEARSSILKIRVEVDDNTTETLERSAEEEPAKILKKRAKIKEKSKMENETTDRTSLTDAEMNKEKALELAHVRKIQADLDRARTRRQKNAKEAEKKPQKFKKNDALLHLEIKKLERDSEVHSLILQLYENDLHENARTLTNALSAKEMSEKSLREQTKMKKAVAKARTMAKLRSEWLEEKARKERERLEMERLRKEREEKERRKRIMAALKRKARNQERQRWAMTSFLETRTSRPYSFSYF